MMNNIVKTIVCLAKSRKLSGRCIAGKEWNNGQPGAWVRPVSDRKTEEVSECERQYEDGSDPKVLDVISIPLLESRPNGCQAENWLLDPEYYWVKQDCLSWESLSQLVDPADDLWFSGESTQQGLNDRVDINVADQFTDSLRFIKLSSLSLSVYVPGIQYGNHKRRVQARFEYNGQPYRLWVTDPVYERKYLQNSDGDYDIGSCYLTISLGELHDDGYHYKMVAAIIEESERQ